MQLNRALNTLLYGNRAEPKYVSDSILLLAVELIS